MRCRQPHRVVAVGLAARNRTRHGLPGLRRRYALMRDDRVGRGAVPSRIAPRAIRRARARGARDRPIIHLKVGAARERVDVGVQIIRKAHHEVRVGIGQPKKAGPFAHSPIAGSGRPRPSLQLEQDLRRTRADFAQVSMRRWTSPNRDGCRKCGWCRTQCSCRRPGNCSQTANSRRSPDTPGTAGSSRLPGSRSECPGRSATERVRRPACWYDAFDYRRVIIWIGVDHFDELAHRPRPRVRVAVIGIRDRRSRGIQEIDAQRVGRIAAGHDCLQARRGMASRVIRVDSECQLDAGRHAPLPA